MFLEKNIGGINFLVDTNNNMINLDRYAKETAIEMLNSLINCKNCVDSDRLENCENCIYCVDCRFTNDSVCCSRLIDCYLCENCSRLISCSNCFAQFGLKNFNGLNLESGLI